MDICLMQLSARIVQMASHKPCAAATMRPCCAKPCPAIRRV